MPCSECGPYVIIQNTFFAIPPTDRNSFRPGLTTVLAISIYLCATAGWRTARRYRATRVYANASIYHSSNTYIPDLVTASLPRSLLGRLLVIVYLPETSLPAGPCQQHARRVLRGSQSAMLGAYRKPTEGGIKDIVLLVASASIKFPQGSSQCLLRYGVCPPGQPTRPCDPPIGLAASLTARRRSSERRAKTHNMTPST
jgi:hypothetical protein